METAKSSRPRCGGLYLYLQIINVTNTYVLSPFLTPAIHNSNHVLSNSERYLLSLGLNFKPSFVQLRLCNCVATNPPACSNNLRKNALHEGD